LIHGNGEGFTIRVHKRALLKIGWGTACETIAHAKRAVGLMNGVSGEGRDMHVAFQESVKVVDRTEEGDGLTLGRTCAILFPVAGYR
jgi:hypothetical protein